LVKGLLAGFTRLWYVQAFYHYLGIYTSLIANPKLTDFSTSLQG
jgi:hypothetical protein